MSYQNKNISLKGENVIKKIDGDFLIVPITGKLAKEGKIFKANSTTIDIIRYIEKNNNVSMNSLIEYIVKSYENKDNQIKKDVIEITNYLVKKEILRLSNGI